MRPSGSGYWYPAEAQPDAALLAALRDYRDAERAMRRRITAAMGINDTDLLALRHLIAESRAGTPVTAKALTSRLDITTAATSALLNRLESSGHVLRTTHPTDGRVVVVQATDRSHREVQAQFARMHRRMLVSAKAVDPEIAVAMIEFLRSMTAAVSEPAES